MQWGEREEEGEGEDGEEREEEAEEGEGGEEEVGGGGWRGGGDRGLAVANFSCLRLFMVSGYRGNSNHDYMCAHVS